MALNATAEEARVHRFGFTLFGLWIVCVGATVWIARAVAAVAVEPIVAATRNIARSAPDQPAASTLRSDEAGVLMETFNRFRDRVDDMVAREREFAANLDHEIRTPLTTIRTDAELLGIEARLEPAQQARLDRIVAAVDEIGATTEATLSHSAGRFVDNEALDLHELVRAACDAMADRAAARSLVVVVAVEVGSKLRASRQALLTIVRNLLRNAVEHAAPATLTITGDARGLTFADDGPGIADAVRAHIFDRHRHGHRVDEGAPPSSGRQRGLGLAIARRLCDMQGWRLAAESPAAASGRGTLFRLDFAPAGGD